MFVDVFFLERMCHFLFWSGQGQQMERQWNLLIDGWVGNDWPDYNIDCQRSSLFPVAKHCTGVDRARDWSGKHNLWCHDCTCHVAELILIGSRFHIVYVNIYEYMYIYIYIFEYEYIYIYFWIYVYIWIEIKIYDICIYIFTIWNMCILLLLWFHRYITLDNHSWPWHKYLLVKPAPYSCIANPWGSDQMERRSITPCSCCEEEVGSFKHLAGLVNISQVWELNFQLHGHPVKRLWNKLGTNFFKNWIIGPQDCKCLYFQSMSNGWVNQHHWLIEGVYCQPRWGWIQHVQRVTRMQSFRV